jgi:hypothetical protein
MPSPIPPAAHRERPVLYGAVLALRWAGFRVFRAGQSKHLLDGRQVDTARLIARGRTVTLQDLESLGR